MKSLDENLYKTAQNRQSVPFAWHRKKSHSGYLISVIRLVGIIIPIIGVFRLFKPNTLNRNGGTSTAIIIVIVISSARRQQRQLGQYE